MNSMNSITKAKAHIQAAEKAENMNNFILAKQEYELAIKCGSCEAKIALAVLYLLNGDEKNSGVRAEALLNEVVSSSSTPAQLVALGYNNLATLYTTGANGIDRNEEKARECLLKAQSLGFPS